MGWFDILLKIIQLIAALIGLWKNGGAEVVRGVLADTHKRVCDERCQIDLRRQTRGGKK